MLEDVQLLRPFCLQVFLFMDVANRRDPTHRFECGWFCFACGLDCLDGMLCGFTCVYHGDMRIFSIPWTMPWAR